MSVLGVKTRLAGALTALALSWSPGGWADEVVMTNGDRLSGTIISKTPEGLRLKTQYAGVIRLDWRQIETLRTDEPIRVLMHRDTRPFNTMLEPANESKSVRLAGSMQADLGAVKLDRIAYINPTPSQSGEGIEYRGRLNVSGSANRGNSDTAQIAAEAELNGEAKTSRFFTRLRGEQRSADGATQAANWLASGDYDWFRGQKKFIYARSSLEYGRYREPELRFIAGSGYGIQLVDSESSKLSFKGGLDVVYEEQTPAGDRGYPALGWGVRYSQWLPQRRAEFFHEQDGYVKAVDTREISVRTRTGLKIPIMARLSAQLQALVDWEEQSLIDKHRTDMSLQFGLGYEW